MIDMHVAIDSGDSDIKAVCKLKGRERLEYLIMSSAIEKIARKQLESYLERKGWVGIPLPEKQAWVEWNGQIYVVGALASQFDPSDRRKEPKYESTLYKVLAVISSLVQKYQIDTRKKIRVELGVLLPWNEYSDRGRFQRQLELMSESFIFRGQKIKLKLVSCVCRPEGSGLVAVRMRTQGLEWFRQQRLGVVMLRKRNFTGLYFEQGKLKAADSPLIGFSFMVDQIVKQTSCLSQSQLTTAIFAGIREARAKREPGEECPSVRPVWHELAAIQSLATARDPNLRTSEVRDIAQALTTVTADWESKVEKFLSELFPRTGLTEMNVSGGPFLFFEPMLEEYFNGAASRSLEACRPFSVNQPFTPLLLGAGVIEQMEDELGLNSDDARLQSLSYRMVDVFSLLDYLIARSVGEAHGQKKA